MQGHVEVEGVSSSLLREIRSTKVYDEDWTQEQGLHLFKGWVYVPKDDHLRTRVIREHHDSTTAGHPGRDKTLELITRNYWWPSLRSDVITYVKSCELCQRTKSFPAKPSGLLQPNAIPTGPWEDISADLITGLPDSHGHDAILMVVDRFTKMIHAISTNAELTSEDLA